MSNINYKAQTPSSVKSINTYSPRRINPNSLLLVMPSGELCIIWRIIMSNRVLVLIEDEHKQEAYELTPEGWLPIPPANITRPYGRYLKVKMEEIA